MNTTRLLTQKGNCVKKKILCLALPGFKMVFSCAVCLAFAAKKRLCICSRAGSLLKPLPRLSQKGASPQLLHRCWLWAWLSNSSGGWTSPPSTIVSNVLGMPKDSNFIFFFVEFPVFPSLTNLLHSYWLRCVQESALRQMNSSF